MQLSKKEFFSSLKPTIEISPSLVVLCVVVLHLTLRYMWLRIPANVYVSITVSYASSSECNLQKIRKMMFHKLQKNFLWNNLLFLTEIRTNLPSFIHLHTLNQPLISLWVFPDSVRVRETTLMQIERSYAFIHARLLFFGQGFEIHWDQGLSYSSDG